MKLRLACLDGILRGLDITGACRYGGYTVTDVRVLYVQLIEDARRRRSSLRVQGTLACESYCIVPLGRNNSDRREMRRLNV